MAADSGVTDPNNEPNPLRPVWVDTPDEAKADRGLHQPRHDPAWRMRPPDMPPPSV